MPTKKDGSKQKPRKKRKTALIIVLSLLGLIAALAITVAILGTGLLNRITRTDAAEAMRQEITETPEQTDEAPDMTPTPTRTPSAAPMITPTPVNDVMDPPATPRGTAQPLSEYYRQTSLTSAQLAKFSANNESDKYINVLLIGADRRSTKGSYNSDTMMIATLDSANGRLKLTTLMRDMLVDIPGYGYGKLNSAAAHGGIQLLFETIEHNFHLKLDKYVLVDFYSFVDIVDAMGGITIKMSAGEISAANDCIAGLNKQMGVEYLWDGFIFAEPGPVKLTGKQALGYARVRHLDSEFKRVERQYEVLNTILAEFLHKGVATQYELLYELVPLVETNMTNDEIISAAIAALTCEERGLLYFRVPVEGMYENGKWEKRFVFFSDIPKMSVALHEFIFESKATAEEARLLEPNPSLPPRTPTPTELLYLLSPSPEPLIPEATPDPMAEPAPDGENIG